MWFAWFPVTTINGRRILFKSIYRRRYVIMSLKVGQLYLTEKYEYATAFDILAQ